MEKSICVVPVPGSDCTPTRRLSRKMCTKHYKRWQKWGDPAMVGYGNWHVLDPLVRFNAKVNKDGPLVPGHPDLGPCWLWRGKPDPQGYGRFSEGGVDTGAHRWSYKRFVGEIADDLCVDHMCHNLDTSCRGGKTCQHRRCVNPGHLVAASRSQNVRRGRGGQHHTEKTRCTRGHEYTGDNLIFNKQGYRLCRECRRQWRHEYRERKRRAA